MQRFDHVDVNLEVINNKILFMGDKNDVDDDEFICGDIIEEDTNVNSDKNIMEWLASESESD